MDNYDIVIGLEIHCELNTKSKMFSSAPVDFHALPNTNVSAIDMAFPGILPRLNKKAVEMAIMVSSALHMDIDKKIVFDRKNYFYPDLTKGYQITQNEFPIGRNGFIEIKVGDDYKKIRINRLHMEEDTAKQIHFDDYTLIDYNRSGIPLIEIVSEPDLNSALEAREYVENLRNILVYLNVSDGKMEEGSLRCDVNISIKPKNSNVFGTRCEIKNINSISNVEKAILYEANRQKEIIESGNKVMQETRRFDDKNQTTVGMRKKTDAIDYKYFREPNLAPIILSDLFVNNTINSMPSLPIEREKMYRNTYELNDNQIEVIIANKDLSDYLNSCLVLIKKDDTLVEKAKIITNYLITDITSYLNEKFMDFKNITIDRNYLLDLVNKQINKEISSTQAKEILKEVLSTNKSVENIIEEKGFKQVNDENQIEHLVRKVLEENKESIAAIKNGKSNAFGYLVGQVMKLSKGQANPNIVSSLLNKIIKEY